MLDMLLDTQDLVVVTTIVDDRAGGGENGWDSGGGGGGANWDGGRRAAGLVGRGWYWELHAVIISIVTRRDCTSQGL